MKRNLREITKTIVPSSFLDYRLYLKALYQEAKERLPDYTYPKFSSDLGLSESNVAWMIINGRRKLTKKNRDRVISALKLSGKEKKFFVHLVEYNNTSRNELQDQAFNKLLDIKRDKIESDEEIQMLEYYSEWYHPLLREVIGDEQIEQDPEKLAARFYFVIHPKQIKESFELLESIGLIQWDSEKNRFVQAGGQITPLQKVDKIAHIRYHERVLELSKQSISKVPKEKRSINSLTVRLSEENVIKAKKMIFDLCSHIMKLDENGSQPALGHQVNIQLFPFIKEK